MNSSTDHGSFPIRPFCDRRRSAKEKEADGARQHGSHENTQLGLLPQQGETKASSCTNSDLVKPTPARKSAPTRWLQVSTGPMRAQANEDPAGEQDPQRLAQQQAQTYAQGDRTGARRAHVVRQFPPRIGHGKVRHHPEHHQRLELVLQALERGLRVLAGLIDLLDHVQLLFGERGKLVRLQRGELPHLLGDAPDVGHLVNPRHGGDGEGRQHPGHRGVDAAEQKGRPHPIDTEQGVVPRTANAQHRSRG